MVFTITYKITEAYDALMLELFDKVPEKPYDCIVDRSTYRKALRKIEARYSLAEGDPEYLEWVLLLIGRSPRFKKEEDKVVR